MTEDEGATKDSLRKNWKSLTVPTEFFRDCWKQPAVYIPADGYSRTFYFLETEEIIFRDRKGEYIWDINGSGQITLPSGVSISAKNVKMRIG